MQRFVDKVLDVTKESVKTFTYESLNNIVRLINGISALLLALLPGKANILEGIQGWELRPTFRGPRLPRWMENGVSSFNQFIHELSVDSDVESLDYLSGEEDDDDDGYDDYYPETPSSVSSRASSRASFNGYSRHRMDWIRYILLWILITGKFVLGIPFRLFKLVYDGMSKPRSVSENQQSAQSHLHARVQTLKDQIIHRTTDRRRGIIEDIHLALEIFIEAVFDIVHKAVYLLLSPSKAFGKLSRLFSSHERGVEDDDNVFVNASVSTAMLGENDPTPTERNTDFRQSFSTDARTCQDVITELGYPYEAIHVITADGYVLLLERIPRRDARKAVYLQHGVFDSSMGWVSNGVVGSPAFAAYDHGYDVFLGNFRGLVSREHIDKNISSREYWRYSINEHGTEDIPAMIEKIHQVKTAELKLSKPDIEEDNDGAQLYKLCAISHSLGGASMLMYIITSRIEEKNHRLSRLILLSPAGFHHDSNLVFSVVESVIFFLAPVLSRIFPAFYIPTRFFRMLFNKLARDLQNLPAAGGLVQTLLGYVLGGDSSNWVGVLGTPHYNMNDMPAVSFYVGLHLAQIKRSRRFRMFDYGSASANIEVYGSPEPLDLGEHYWLIDIPVDLVAGHKDRVIRPSMVKRHYRLMKEVGVDVSFNEFEYAHLDFTFSHREELLSYVMSRLFKWDPMLAHCKVLEECPNDGTSIVHWIKKFPFFCSDREYIIARRIWQAGNAYYCVTKGVPYPSLPKRDKPRRVDQYFSSWVIKPVESRKGDGQLSACEVTLLHHEDMGIPKDVAKLGVRHGMWGAVKKLHSGMRAYQNARKTDASLSRCALMASKTTKISFDRNLHLSNAGSLVEERGQGINNTPQNGPGLDWKWVALGGAIAVALGIQSGAVGRALLVGAGHRFARR